MTAPAVLLYSIFVILGAVGSGSGLILAVSTICEMIEFVSKEAAAPGIKIKASKNPILSALGLDSISSLFS
jgi:hypothetical protein